jgi:hypothetical protein
MKIYKQAFLFLFLIVGLAQPFVGKAQEQTTLSRVLKEEYLSPTLQFLASPSLEGRETGTRGSLVAADYIASRMMQSGLKPAFRTAKPRENVLSEYFQPFKLLRYTPTKAVIEIPSASNNQSAVQLQLTTDFTVEDAFGYLTGKYPLVFAGYGIQMPAIDYDNYKQLDAKGKIVILMEGYPGAGDTLSANWKLFKSIANDDSFDLEKRYHVADSLGAVAVFVLKDELWTSRKPEELHKNKDCGEDVLYQDAEYLLPVNKSEPDLPIFSPTLEACQSLVQAYGLRTFLMKDLFNGLSPVLQDKSDCSVKIDLKVEADTLVVYNVGGLLRGIDTTRTFIVGAHYDHLGKRGEMVYYGSDDNASGVTGVLSMAAIYSGSGKIPPVNMLFTCWTAEEKGLIGSEYYASQLENDKKIEMYLNMDMISRSAPEDTATRIISIGTRTADQKLRKMAEKVNQTLEQPFNLDLWDVTGHTGSDYASFTAKGIPVMTFFSGFHDEYHTPCDVPSKADFRKMTMILRLVKSCIDQFMIAN